MHSKNSYQSLYRIIFRSNALLPSNVNKITNLKSFCYKSKKGQTYVTEEMPSLAIFEFLRCNPAALINMKSNKILITKNKSRPLDVATDIVICNKLDVVLIDTE